MERVKNKIPESGMDQAHNSFVGQEILSPYLLCPPFFIFCEMLQKKMNRICREEEFNTLFLLKIINMYIQLLGVINGRLRSVKPPNPNRPTRKKCCWKSIETNRSPSKIATNQTLRFEKVFAVKNG